ncbi:MAG: tol-pal system protein YbgF [Nitrospirae bacterium]|nr:tol-pal system protein YbgF [Nitrospirota bacterium]
MKTLIRWLLFVGTVPVIFGCVTTTSDYTALRNDLNQLTRLYNEQQKELVAIKQQVIDYKSFLDRSPSKDAFEAIRNSQIKLNDQISEINDELQQLQNRLEESTYRINKTLKESTEERAQLRAEIDSLKEELASIKEKIALIGTTAQQKTVPQTQQPAPQAQPATETKEKKELTPFDVYQAALKKLEQGKIKEARADFQDFIKKYKDSDLVDNAQFWIAESYYKEGSYEDAILEYDALINKYPKSNKVPGAMLKQAYSFLKLNDTNTARVILNRLIQRFPNSKEAELAKKKLESISKAKKKTQ